MCRKHFIEYECGHMVHVENCFQPCKRFRKNEDWRMDHVRLPCKDLCPDCAQRFSQMINPTLSAMTGVETSIYRHNSLPPSQSGRYKVPATIYRLILGVAGLLPPLLPLLPSYPLLPLLPLPPLCDTSLLYNTVLPNRLRLLNRKLWFFYIVSGGLTLLLRGHTAISRRSTGRSEGSGLQLTKFAWGP